ncbi:unnamed protein product [Cuscuta epithymum]|uniref:Uncharacterized protein n=1 Tax=Cuscuta epithymum TaxID=186058 RepID=A0AAV0ECG1_9ASTE|nr:unnamed protein product [Cuscuta epithymum]
MEECEGSTGLGNFSDPESYETRADKFFDLLKESERKVYPNSKYSKLSCLVHLFHLKCLNGWSNKSFTMLLEFLQDLLPDQNLMPKTTYQVKKLLGDLGLGYEKIHACPNDCMLFWDDTEKENECSICGQSRWLASTDNTGEIVNAQNKKAAKILRWFPLKPRL